MLALQTIAEWLMRLAQAIEARPSIEAKHSYSDSSIIELN